MTPNVSRPSEAFKNVVRRLLEASGRGMWDADDETIEKLKSLYSDADDLVRSCMIARYMIMVLYLILSSITKPHRWSKCLLLMDRI